MPAPATTMIRLDCSMVAVNCRRVVCVDSGDEAWSRLTCFILSGVTFERGEQVKGMTDSKVNVERSIYRSSLLFPSKEAGSSGRVSSRK